MELRRARAPLALISLLAVGAWTGSSLAQGATRARSALTVGLPTVSVPGVSVPVAGVTVTTPAVSVPVPPVTVSVPPVTATVPPVTVSTPVVGVTTPPVTVATPPVRVTTPSPTVSVPAVHVTAPLPVPGTVSKPVAAVLKPVAAAVKPVAAAVNATTTAVAAATKAATLATGTAVAKTVKTAKTALEPVAASTSKTAAKTKSSTTRTASSRNATSTATSRTAPATATRTARLRAARVRSARLRAARQRAARARHARLVRAARQRRRAARALRLAQVQPPPQVPVTPPLSPDPALPVLNGVEPYQLTDPAATPTSTSIDALLLPISTAAAAAPLVGVTVRSSSTLRATAPPERPFPPSGGFNGASRFAMFLLGETSLVLTPAPTTPGDAPAPVISRTPVLAPANGGRSQATVSGGVRGGMSIETPLGRITISRHGYVFGSAHYPLASVRGVATTVLISLAALAAVGALLALGGAADRRLRGGAGRRGSGSRRPARGTRGELYAAARRKQIPGRSRMSKAELKRALDDG